MGLSFLKGYVYSVVNIPTMKNELRLEGVGAFAFYNIEEQNVDPQGRAQTMEWALHQANGNNYLAERMLKMTSEHYVGCAFLKPGGVIQAMKLDCRKISKVAKSLNDLTADMIKNGFPIDPKKLCDPCAAYRTPDF